MARHAVAAPASRIGTFLAQAGVALPRSAAGAMVMAQIRRPWTWEEVEKLLNMAQKYPTAQILPRWPANTFSLRIDRDRRQDLLLADHAE
jgi:hypothetical protein